MQMFEMVFDLLVKKLVVETKQYSPLRAKFWSCMHLLPFWILQRDIANAVNHRILCDVHPNLIAFPIFIMLHKLRLPGWIGMKCIVICQCADSTRKAQHTDYFTEWTVKACLQHLNSTQLNCMYKIMTLSSSCCDSETQVQSAYLLAVVVQQSVVSQMKVRHNRKDTVQYAATSPPDCRARHQTHPQETCYPPAEYSKPNCTTAKKLTKHYAVLWNRNSWNASNTMTDFQVQVYAVEISDNRSVVNYFQI